ncbi:MAG TPA: four helix bundle protein [Gemmatimonadales bacterium]
MPSIDLKVRTKAFALDALRIAESLPRTRAGDVIGRQLLRAGTSVAANYRSACRARSRREFIAKMGVVLEEADESEFWLEMIGDSGLLGAERVRPLRSEAGELVAIAVASIKTARGERRSILHSSFCIPPSA